MSKIIVKVMVVNDSHMVNNWYNRMLTILEHVVLKWTMVLINMLVKCLGGLFHNSILRQTNNVFKYVRYLQLNVIGLPLSH